jgi:hypothetical protein
MAAALRDAPGDHGTRVLSVDRRNHPTVGAWPIGVDASGAGELVVEPSLRLRSTQAAASLCSVLPDPDTWAWRVGCLVTAPSPRRPSPRAAVSGPSPINDAGDRQGCCDLDDRRDP